MAVGEGEFVGGCGGGGGVGVCGWLWGKGEFVGGEEIYTKVLKLRSSN